MCMLASIPSDTYIHSNGMYRNTYLVTHTYMYFFGVLSMWRGALASHPAGGGK